MKVNLLVLTALIIFSGIVFSQNVNAAYNNEKWEYLWYINSYDNIDDLIDKIDELGKESWELVDVTEDEDAFYTLFFKRLLAGDDYQWEYLAYVCPYDEIKELVNEIDKLGNNRWELVAVTEDSDAFYTLFFKRKLNADNYRWRYMVYINSLDEINKLTEEINKLGNERWELVAATEDADFYYTLFFKRKVNADNSRWEYKAYINSYEDIKELIDDINKLGRDRWELVVATEDANDFYTLFLKRRLGAANNRWEYMVYINSHEAIDKLLVDIDKLGEQKWDLVTVTEDEDAYYTLFFMRKLN